MAHLTDITRETRIILKLLALALVVVTMIFILLRGGIIIKTIFFPSPPPPPQMSFGKLPQVSFPTQNPRALVYRINTLTGKLSSFPDLCTFYEGHSYCQMKVYKIKKNLPSLVALKTIRENLRSQGFMDNETKISESVYQWTKASGDLIQIDILTNDFKITSSFLTEPPPQRVTGITTKKDGAFKTATNFLEDIGEDISDFDQEKSTLTYLKISDGRVTAADSLNDAQFARIDIFQKNLSDHEVYYPGFEESLMYFNFRNENNIPRIVDASFSHSIPDQESSSTYPIKTPEQAYEDLKRGNAYILNKDDSSSLIDITEVNAGYYVGQEDQQYFLPVIVFKGKNFTAYVQAVKDL